MKLNTPKEQPYALSKIYYVESESQPGQDHIVVQVGSSAAYSLARVYFCDCRDFFIRHLPLYGTAAFSLCKHGRFVRDGVEWNTKVGGKTDDGEITWTNVGKAARKFGVYVVSDWKTSRSKDIRGTFDSREEAQAMLDNYTERYGSEMVRREVREIEIL